MYDWHRFLARTIPMNNFTGLLRELRLMRDQPSHRFYAVWLLVVLFVGRGLLAISLILGCGYVLAPEMLTKLLSRFF